MTCKFPAAESQDIYLKECEGTSRREWERRNWKGRTCSIVRSKSKSRSRSEERGIAG